MRTESEWRPAGVDDDEAIVAMSLALYAEDPSPAPVSAAQVRATIERLRREPGRGLAAVLDIDGARGGYALLVAYWSNELGGEVCIIDELYVAPAWRSRGYATRLVDALVRGEVPWRERPVAVELEVSPKNAAASRLYERLGFRAKRNTTMRRMPAGSNRPGD